MSTDPAVAAFRFALDEVAFAVNPVEAYWNVVEPLVELFPSFTALNTLKALMKNDADGVRPTSIT